MGQLQCHTPECSAVHSPVEHTVVPCRQALNTCEDLGLRILDKRKQLETDRWGGAQVKKRRFSSALLVKEPVLMYSDTGTDEVDKGTEIPQTLGKFECRSELRD